MSLVRYEPYSLLDRLQKEFNRFGALDPFAREAGEDDNSDVVVSQWRPAVDIRDEQDRFVILADLPGVNPEDIDVTMENGALTLKGERSNERTEEGEEGYRRVERARGTFFRRFSLPDTADAERIQANSRNGVLEIVLPKHEKVQPKRITVNS